jgi:hypothetical protein
VTCPSSLAPEAFCFPVIDLGLHGEEMFGLCVDELSESLDRRFNSIEAVTKSRRGVALVLCFRRRL